MTSSLDKREMVDVERVKAWFYSKPRKSAVHAFTAGAERQLAYMLEEASTASAVASAEVARLRAIEHAAWHAIEASAEDADGAFVPMAELLELSKLLPEAHPGNDDAAPTASATVSGEKS